MRADHTPIRTGRSEPRPCASGSCRLPVSAQSRCGLRCSRRRGSRSRRLATAGSKRSSICFATCWWTRTRGDVVRGAGIALGRVGEPLLDAAHPDEIGSSLYESDYVACAWGQIELAAERGLAFDVVHDHSGFTALAMADRVDAAVVHTIHGPFDPETAPFYQRHGHKAVLVAISRSQAESAPSRRPHRRLVPTRSRSIAGRCANRRRITCCGSGGWTR